MRIVFLLWFGIGSFLVGVSAQKDPGLPPVPPAPPAPTAPPSPTAAEVKALVVQMDSESGREREAATRAIANGLREHFKTWKDPVLGQFRLLDEDAIEPRIRIEAVLRETAVWFHHERPNRGFLGVTLLEATIVDGEEKRVPAMKIQSVVNKSSAKENGVEAGDLVIAIDGIRIPERTDVKEFISYIQTKTAGEEVRLDLVRDGELKRLEFPIGKRPEGVGSVAFPRTEQNDEVWFRDWLAASLRRLQELEELEEREVEATPAAE